MNENAFVANVLLFMLTAHIGESGAVCIDPKTSASGYKIPLNEEVRTPMQLSLVVFWRSRDYRKIRPTQMAILLTM